MAHEVFISYAADDKSVADAVCAALERRQIPCWIAPRDARPGLDYADSIVDALDETSVMVFVLSSRSIASPHVKREVEQAANRGTNIIPFRIEDVQLSRGLRYFLGTVHYIDAITPPIDKQVEYLGDTVQYFLDRKGAAGTSGAVAPAGPRDPEPPSVLSPSIPPGDRTASPAAVERSPIAGPPAAAAPIGSVPAEPPSEPARAASVAPPTAAPVHITVPKGVEVASARPSEGIDATRSTAEARPPVAEPVSRPGAHAEGPPALRPETKNPVWQVVGFGTIGAALGELVGFSILAAIVGFDPDMYKFAFTLVFTTIVSAALVTWSWLYAVRQPTLSPAVAGGLSGLVGGWLSAAIARAAITDAMPSYFLIAQALQSGAVGIAGGVAAGFGGSARPAVRMGIALACVSFVRTLYLARERDANAILFLVLDVPIAIGWGVGMIACPATTAALRGPLASGDAATAGGSTSHSRT